jgi:hypothetical protein
VSVIKYIVGNVIQKVSWPVYAAPDEAGESRG